MDQQFIKVAEKHPRLLRITHWLNVILLSLMIWSGILIYWADQAFIMIPDELIEALNIHHRLAEGMGWHFFIMWPLTINGLVYGAYLLLSGERKYQSYNSAQKVVYPIVFLMGVASIMTGLAIYKPVQLRFVVELLGGYHMVRKAHFYLMIGFIVFIMIHVIQVIRAGWNTFRGMVAGYEIEK